MTSPACAEEWVDARGRFDGLHHRLKHLGCFRSRFDNHPFRLFLRGWRFLAEEFPANVTQTLESVTFVTEWPLLERTWRDVSALSRLPGNLASLPQSRTSKEWRVVRILSSVHSPCDGCLPQALTSCKKKGEGHRRRWGVWIRTWSLRTHFRGRELRTHPCCSLLPPPPPDPTSQYTSPSRFHPEHKTQYLVNRKPLNCYFLASDLEADEVFWKVENGFEFKDKVEEKHLVAVLKQGHFTENLVMDANRQIRLHLARKRFQQVVLVWNESKRCSRRCHNMKYSLLSVFCCFQL